MMKYLTFIMFLCVIGIFGIGQTIYDEYGEEYNIYNFTDQLQWNSSFFSYEGEGYNFTEYDTSQLKINRLNNIVNKFIDFAGYTSFESMKFAIEWGFEHPEIEYSKLVYWVKWIIAIILIGAIAPATVPIIALIYVIYLGIKRGVLKIKGLFIKKEDT